MGLTVILIFGLLAIFVSSLLLILAPWWVTSIRDRLPALSAGAVALLALVVLCIGLWRHAGWTWWLLAVPAYTFGVLGLLLVWSEPDMGGLRIQRTVLGLLYLVDVVWYFQFKPSVVNYYAAIGGARQHLESKSRGDAA